MFLGFFIEFLDILFIKFLFERAMIFDWFRLFSIIIHLFLIKIPRKNIDKISKIVKTELSNQIVIWLDFQKVKVSGDLLLDKIKLEFDKK